MCGPCLLREAAGGRLCPRHRRLDSRQETIRPEMRRCIEARALLEGERDRGELELGLAIGEAAAQVRAARLMRGAIRGHQRQSGTSRSPDEGGHQQRPSEANRGPSEAIRGNPRQSKAHPRQSDAIRGNPRQSEAIRGTQRHSEALRGTQRPIKGPSEGLRGPSQAISGPQWRARLHLHREHLEAAHAAVLDALCERLEGGEG